MLGYHQTYNRIDLGSASLVIALSALADRANLANLVDELPDDFRILPTLQGVGR